MSTPRSPLSGLKVLDLTRVLAGPFATRMLSDLGADVLKVEPPSGDITRRISALADRTSGFFIQQNIGKRTICIDLTANGARDLVLDLASRADVVIENFRPGVLERLGLGWKDLSTSNPRLVMVSISGFGQDGPNRGRAAYACVIHAESGLIQRQALRAGSGLADIEFSLADSFASLHALVGMFAALHLSRATGYGQHVDISMRSALCASDDYVNYALDDTWESKPQHYSIFDAPEGKHVLIAGPLDWIWRSVSELGDLPAFAGEMATSGEHQRSVLADHFLSFSSFEDLTRALDQSELAWGQVRHFGEGFDPELREGLVVDVLDESGHKRQTTQSPYRFSDASAGVPAGTRAPRLGEHNQSALADWLQLSKAAIEAYERSGVLQCERGDGKLGGPR